MTKVIASKNLPARWPISLTVLMWLLLDRLKPPSWVWGVVFTLLSIIWLIAGWLILFDQEAAEVKFKDGEK